MSAWSAHSPQAILFDLDDTLLAFDQGADFRNLWRMACEPFSQEFGDLRVESLVSSIQAKGKWYWSDPQRHLWGRLHMTAARRTVVETALQELGLTGGPLADKIAARYWTERERRFRLFPGALETLKHLKQLGIKMALLTNGEAQMQRAKIERFDLAPWFDAILIEGEFGIGKPDERIYRHALAELQVDPQFTWMVGDNLEWEVLAPQRLGIRGIWLNHRGADLAGLSDVVHEHENQPEHENKHDQPFRIIHNVIELLDLIEYTGVEVDTGK
ncbi:MAG: hypothetical protein A2201_10135 [Alicyclobacillus sp. RIFOXYA1_FULL_53_8]|nr:MAG: hypothetical protein A2201_10135 [Alicyclobacillus sp. RIFOXYA1_FULL_53_8]